MKKSVLIKNTFREIKGSFARFFAILAIIALGVGFFSGLKVTTSAMVKTADNYLKENNFYDMKLVSTIGFTDDDLKYIRKNTDNYASESLSYTADVLYDTDKGLTNVLRAHSITKDINDLSLIEGRMPKTDDECVVDSKLFGREYIGKYIELSKSNAESDLNKFKFKKLKIVGRVKSPVYIQFERGTSSIGNGTVKGFIYLNSTAFSMDYYTEMYVKLVHSYKIYSEEYKAFYKEQSDKYKPVLEKTVESRYNNIVADANEKLKSAKNKLDESEQTLNNSKAEIDKNLLDLKNQEKKLNDTENELNKNKKLISDGIKECEIKEEELNNNLSVIKIKKDELNSNFSDYDKSFLEFQNIKDELIEKFGGYSNIPDEIKKKYKLDETEQTLNFQKQKLNDAQNEIIKNENDINSGLLSVSLKKEDLNKKLIEIDNGFSEINLNKAKIDEGMNKINDAKAQYDDGKIKLDDSKKEYEKNEENANNIEKPKSFILGRDTNVGYVCFENDSNIVYGIADIFPVFFFSVAALVCITTMTRMIEEQRTQIGILKALGYTQKAIIGKYLFYSGAAAVIGCILGYFTGTIVFPKVIWYTYDIMYLIDDLQYVFDLKLAMISLVVSLCCSVGITMIYCGKELLEVPSQLIRPKAPKAGKRVLLERIPFIWSKMKFLHKVSYRNIFRYKKRFFMMVIGISGCTALLVTGYGIKDSIANVANQQFNEIQTYDLELNFLNPITEQIDIVKDKLQNNLVSYNKSFNSSMDVKTNNKTKETTVVVMDDKSDTQKFINLHTVKHKKIDYPKLNECVINKKLADTLDLKIGDKIKLQDDKLNSIEVKIVGINQNFVYSYVYISTDTYVKNTGVENPYKTLLINLTENSDKHALGAELMKLKSTASVSINKDTMDRFSNMIKSLNLIVFVVILCAAGLAFIVLYNLTNINITERIREIATIKVLGFTKKETSSYVFRENVVLTSIGTVFGLFLGILLHYLVMSKISLDVVCFEISIKPISFVYSAVLTILFSLIINFIMSFKLDKINMTESLKSVD